MDISLNRSTGTIRSTNLYTPPTVRSNIFNQNQVNGNLVNGVNLPPPLPPRDTFAPFSGLEPASLNPPGSATTSLLLPATNVIRHNFTWSSLENDSQTSTHNKSTSSKIKVDVASSSKLLSFPTTFGVEKSGPQTMCCSISRGGQLINTKLGCLLNIEPSSVGSSLLLYVEAINQSNGFLRLPPSCRLCSNIIHFYTHYHDVIRGHGSFSPEVQPEKDVPHFNRQLVVEFPLRKSALNLHDKQENTLKILVSYDEGLTWEETNSYIEKVAFEKSSHPNDAAHVIYTETDELGMYAVVLSPHHDVKAVSSSNNKIVSSASPAVTVSVDLSHNENATIEIMAELVKPKIIEKLQNQDFPYLVDCSRKLSLHLLNQEYQENRSNSVTIHLPCNLPHNTSHTDISYRILKKSEEPVAGGWCATRKGIWEDVTQKECLNLQVSNKGKRLLGSAHSNSHLVSFNLLIKDAMWTSLIVTAVRSFSQSLTNHLVQVPDKIENLQTASSLSFLVHQKSNRRSHVTCDIVSSKDADNINNIYRDSGSYCGPPPSLPQVVHERDIINICTVGGITFSKRSGETSRKIVFNSALLPFSEQFNIQGTSCTYNSRDNYVGFVEITVSPSSTENDENSAASPKPRSALNSESSVLVMENQTVNERTPSQSSSVQELGKSLLASLPLEIPRKHKSKQIKQTSSSHNTVKSSLSDETLHLVCRGLDKLEFYELAFQLNIPTHRVDEVFAENTESPEAAGMAMLRHWQNEMVVLDQDAVPPLCVALRCIGRENMSQDVAKLCNPFVLEELSGLAPLPEQMQENCET